MCGHELKYHLLTLVFTIDEFIDMTAFTKPGGRMLLSICDYDYSEHPFPPFAVTQEEVISLYSSSFEIPKILQELDASKTAEIFELAPDGVFPVITFSRMS